MVKRADERRAMGDASQAADSTERGAWRRDVEAQYVLGKLGQRIRRHRERRRISLNAASELTGIPAATLSRIENNKMAPTFPVLLKLMTGLRISLASIIGPTDPSSRKAQISFAFPDQSPPIHVLGYAYSALHADSPLCRYTQPLVFDVLTRTIEGAGGLRGHEGTEFCYVLSGTLVLHFKNRPAQELQVGASALFDGETPHAYVAKGRRRTRVLNLIFVDPMTSDENNRRAFREPLQDADDQG